MTTLLPYDPAPLRPLTEKLDAWRQRLDYKGVLPRAWAGHLRRELEAEAIAASTSMEGVPVTVDEVRRILAGEPPPEVRREDRELVEGYREAMEFVFRRADDPAFRWNRELLVALHDRILAGRYDHGAGRIRTDKPALVVNRAAGKQVFLPPAGEDVPDLVDEACSRMEEGHPHPGIAAGWIHVAVAAIHPFHDGNGRGARVCASLSMYRGDFKRPEFTSLEEWWGHHLEEYYGGFRCLGDAFDREADVTPFLQAHLEAQLHQVRALDNREKVERQIWTALEGAAEDAHLDRRLVNALWDAFFGREVTAGYYRSLADVSPATATNDLAAAVSSGLLIPEGQRRGRRYVPGDRLCQLVAAAINAEVSGPPHVARAVIVSDLSRRLTLSGEALGTENHHSPPGRRKTGKTA
ncbi:MAG: Fic family protein [Actinobacteria bacterium]|nr:Fic family protein [Actinomycetota bacterium]